MPEGDTIWRAAARLETALVGQVIRRFEAPRSAVAGPVAGTSIDAVEARGKYLLITFGDGRILETHMKMSGSWHLYRSGERWRRSPRAMRALIETEGDWVAVCFSAPHVRVVRRADGPNHHGPDLTSPAPDLEAALARFPVVLHDTPMGVVLLDQRVFCGVGNVYKSEVLHACRVSPLVPVQDVPVAVRRTLLETAHAMLRANLGSHERITANVPGGLAVYGRAGEPCHRCGTAIDRIVQGEHVRSTYWCPGCQVDRPARGEIQLPGVTKPES